MSATGRGQGSVSAWRRVQVIATAAIGLALVSVLAFAGELIPPVLFFGVLYLAVAAAIWRLAGNSWVSVVGAVLVVLGILGNAPFLIEDLSHPDSWASFAPAAVMLVGAVAAVGAAVMGWRAAPEEQARQPSAWRWWSRRSACPWPRRATAPRQVM